MTMIYDGNSALRNILKENEATLFLRATCKDHLGDFFRFEYASTPSEVLLVNIAPSGGLNGARSLVYDDAVIDGSKDINSFIEEITQDHRFQRVNDSEIQNITPAFAVTSPEFFQLQNAPSQIAGREILYPLNKVSLARFISKFVKLKMPFIYKKLFDRPWIIASLRGRYENWNELLAEAILASGFTFTVVPDEIKVIWFPPLYSEIYAESTKDMVECGSQHAKTCIAGLVSIEKFYENTSVPLILELGFLSLSSKPGKEFIARALLKFTVDNLMLAKPLSPAETALLEKKINRSLIKMKIKQSKTGKIIWIPSGGRAAMVCER